MEILSAASLSHGDAATNLKADVVVVGGGGSGLAAALTAARAGCDVLVIEKASRPGGTTAQAVGSISVNRTRLQAAVGIADHPDAHFEDMGKFAGDLAQCDNLDLRRLYVDGIAETFAWLLDLGLVFDGPFEEPPHRVPRMHLVLPHAESYIKRLLKAMGKHRLRIVTGARLEGLIFEHDRVVGVVARTGGDPETALHHVAGGKLQIRAGKGVVLATGDFSASRALKERFVGPPRSGAMAINPLSTGDGHLVATRHGARVLNGHVVWGPELRFPRPPGADWARQLPDWPWLVRAARFAYRRLPGWISKRLMAKFQSSFMGPSPKLFEAGALLVDAEGNLVSDRSPDALGQRGEGEPFWIVFDGAIAEQFESWPGYVSTAPGIAYAYLDDYRRMRPDVTHQAPSLEALAAKIGWTNPAKVMAAFGPAAAKPSPGPYYALGPVYSMIPFTDGGLAVSPKMEVLGAGDKPIPGLYAAGSAGQGGLILNGHGHHIGWAFLSGRITGSEVAGAAGFSQKR